MKNRRLTSILFLTAAFVFLFLCLSCGIPTYIVPNVTFSSVSSGNNADSFTVAYKCSDPLGDSGRVGLLLLYHIDGTTPTSNTKITSEFKKQFVPTEYNGANVDVTEGTPVLTASDVNVYAFETNGSVISDPDYTILLPNTDEFSRNVELDYTDGKILLKIGGIQAAALSLDPATRIGNYIGIYAAVSVKSNSYTNHYWSDLKFVGYIKITDSE